MWDFQALRPDLVIIDKKRRIVKSLILHFLEIRRLRKRRLRNRKVSRSKKGVTEDFESEIEDYISCGLFRCYTRQLYDRLKGIGVTVSSSSEDSFIRNNKNIKKSSQILRYFPV